MRSDIDVTTPSEREVRSQLIIDAPRETIWRAFTESAFIARWWARGNEMVVERFEPIPGGHWRFLEHAPDGDYGFEGRFAEVKEPVRLSQTFEFDGAPGHVSLTTVEFEATDADHTRLTETTMFMTVEDREAMLSEGMLDGMAQSYDALDRLLGSMR